MTKGKISILGLSRGFFRSFALLLFWLLCPPIFFFLGKKWSKMSVRKRWLLSCLSPVAILVFLIVIFMFSFEIEEYSMKNKYRNREDIGKMIGVEFPQYKEEYRFLQGGRVSFNGDYAMIVNLKFSKNCDLTKFYKEFETLKAEDPFHHISSSDLKCSFSRIDDYTFFYLDVNKPDSTVVLKYGSW